MKKLLCSLLAFCLFMGLFYGLSLNTYAKEDTYKNITQILPLRKDHTIKEAYEADDSGKFSEERVIVRIAGEDSQPFSNYETFEAEDGDFFGVEVEDVKDLMELEPKQEGVGILSIPQQSDSIKVITLKNKGERAVKSAIAQLNKNSNVVYAEPDYKMKTTAVTPNDPNFDTPSMWGLKKIQAPYAWDTTTGSGSVVVAIIDTGIDYTHPDLVANLWTNPGEIADDGIDNDGNGFIDDVHGWSYIWGEESSNRVFDNHGHGTHVAGIIGAVGNNNIGAVGVNHNVKLMPIKALNNGGEGYTSDLIMSVDYARLMGAKIINNSYGGDEYSQAQKDAIDNTDALFVVAAGNSAKNNDATPVYPANYNCPNIITVAATTKNDSLVSFSNYGSTKVHIAAPGEEIFSTMPAGTYGVMSGTSMATPYVAGVAALVLAANPSMTVQQIKNRLISSVDSVASLSGKVSSGGRLNAYKAVNPGGGTQPTYVPPTPTPPPTFTGFAGGDGSSGNPYKVSTPSQLNAVRNYANKSFIQINDIDMTYDTQNKSGKFYNETQGWDGRFCFEGVYNGNGKRIIGLKSSIGGLIDTNIGYIMNLGLEDGFIVGAQPGGLVTGNSQLIDFHGGLKEPEVLKTGRIINCYNENSVTAYGGYAGGIASMNSGEISKCYNAGEVSDINDYVIQSGGITSINWGQITNCYNLGKISSTNPVALDIRLAGVLNYGVGIEGSGTIVKNCYNAGILENRYGSGYGGIAESNYGATLQNNYCLGHFWASLGTVLSEPQMKQQSSFVGWDFNNIWSISLSVNNGYPTLKKTVVPVPTPTPKPPTPTPKPTPSASTLPFKDVKTTDWFYEDVAYVYKKKIADGTSKTTYSPNAGLTRAAFITFMWRVHGSPKTAGLPFKDVKKGQYYTQAVAWGKKNGIIDGVSKTKFAPKGKLTRQAMATMIYRYEKKIKKYPPNKTQAVAYSAITDKNTASSYAKLPLEKCYNQGMLRLSSNNIRPKANATRAEMARVLHYLMVGIGK